MCIGTVVLLLRIPRIPAWDSLYAEDQGVYLFDALAHPWHLLVPYGGYEELVPRLVGQLISYLPLVDVAVPFALAAAGIAALCALFIYHALDGWIQSRWLRALVGAALILLPLAPIEPADSIVGSPWYVMTALFFGLLWRPKNWAGMTAAALVAFVAASSEILAVIYAPLVLLRVVALPRWREQAVTAGWLAGLLVQVPVVLESYAQHTQRVTRPGQSHPGRSGSTSTTSRCAPSAGGCPCASSRSPASTARRSSSAPSWWPCSAWRWSPAAARSGCSSPSR